MMKQTLTFLAALLISISSFAQQGINYKALIKDDEQQGIIDGQKAKDNVHDKSIEALVARLNIIESNSSN